MVFIIETSISICEIYWRNLLTSNSSLITIISKHAIGMQYSWAEMFFKKCNGLQWLGWRTFLQVEVVTGSKVMVDGRWPGINGQDAAKSQSVGVLTRHLTHPASSYSVESLFLFLFLVTAHKTWATASFPSSNSHALFTEFIVWIVLSRVFLLRVASADLVLRISTRKSNFLFVAVINNYWNTIALQKLILSFLLTSNRVVRALHTDRTPSEQKQIRTNFIA